MAQNFHDVFVLCLVIQVAKGRQRLKKWLVSYLNPVICIKYLALSQTQESSMG